MKRNATRTFMNRTQAAVNSACDHAAWSKPSGVSETVFPQHILPMDCGKTREGF